MAAKAWPRSGPTKEAALLDLVGAIYDVALAPDDLPLLLSRLVNLVGALWAPMSVVSLNGGETVSFHNVEGDPAHLSLFNSRYVTAQHNPAAPLLLAARPGTIVQRERYFTDADWEHREVYQQIYRPIGAEASLGVVLHKTRHHFVPLGLMRPKSFGPYRAEDLDMLERAIPHLMRMIQILLRLNDLAGQNAAGAALWDRLPYGIILLDETGRLLWANRSAEVMLSAGDSVGARGDFLRAVRPGEDAALQRLIGEAAATGRGRGGGSGGFMALPRGDGCRPLAVLVAPFPIDRGALFASRRAAAVVFLSDPECQARAPLERLAELYRLTPREAELVALLIDGLDPRAAAERLEISFNTVRSHLAQVFVKTGTHRQTELISLILRSTIVLAAEDSRLKENGQQAPTPS